MLSKARNFFIKNKNNDKLIMNLINARIPLSLSVNQLEKVMSKYSFDVKIKKKTAIKFFKKMAQEEFINLYNKTLYDNIVPTRSIISAFSVSNSDFDNNDHEYMFKLEEDYVKRLQRIMNTIPVSEIFNSTKILDDIVAIYKSKIIHTKELDPMIRVKLKKIIYFLIAHGFLTSEARVLTLLEQKIPEDLVRMLKRTI